MFWLLGLAQRQLCQAMRIAGYETNLTEGQWELVEPMLPAARKLGRKRTSLRRILDALLYIAKAGCQWRLLPVDFPPWQTIYAVFRKWIAEGLWAGHDARLRALVRAKAGKRCRPTAAILDSQSVKSSPHGGETGYDAGKKIKGRKRHILVDTMGLLLGVKAAPASTPERAGAMLLLAPLLFWFPWLRKLWVDGGYSGPEFADWVRGLRPKLHVEVVKRSDTAKGFQLLAHRWVVERTFSWLMRHRRLVRNHETSAASAEAFVLIAMIRIQIRRLA